MAIGHFLKRGGATMRALAVLFIALCAIGQTAWAAMDEPLGTRITPEVLEQAFPGGQEIGEVTGEPPAAPVLIDGEIVGYLTSTHNTVRSTGFAGEPFDILVGIDLAADLKGIVLLEHYEPIIGPSMIRGDLLQRFLDRLKNLPTMRANRATQRAAIDGVSGATVSSKLMRSAAFASGRKIAMMTGVAEDQSNEAGLSIDLGSGFSAGEALLATSPAGNLTAANSADRAVAREDRRWRDLVEVGDIAHLTFTNADAAEAFPADLDISAFRQRPSDDTFFEVYTAMVTPDGIGRNVYGQRWHNFNMTQVSLGDHIVLIAGFGDYRVLGSGQAQSNTLSNFERVAIVQNGKTIRLTRDKMLKHNAVRVHGAPRFKEQELFRLRPRDGFDPFEPWHLQIEIVPETVGAPTDAPPAFVEIPYRIPAAFVLGDDYALEEAGFKEPHYAVFGMVRESTLNEWQTVWLERRVDIAILAGLLGVLTLILLFQNSYVRDRRIHAGLRFGFLAVILVWLGWLKDAQLTTINIIAYFQAAFTDLDPVLFLLDPLIFLLSVYVAISLVLWGRGVFCGWLCPFGALQEILAKIAQWLKVPQITIRETLQERLWMIKYVVVFVMFGLAPFSMEAVTKVGEVEPFKTAIVVGFDRSWPYLLYAGILLAVGLTIERFFCRFLCPLGGALAILGRFHLLHWLKRRPECGSPCQVCRSSCPIGAIRVDGAIDMNECFQCLDCQVDYSDPTVCPPLIARRKRADRLQVRPLTPGPVTS